MFNLKVDGFGQRQSDQLRVDRRVMRVLVAPDGPMAMNSDGDGPLARIAPMHDDLIYAVFQEPVDISRKDMPAANIAAGGELQSPSWHGILIQHGNGYCMNGNIQLLGDQVPHIDCTGPVDPAYQYRREAAFDCSVLLFQCARRAAAIRNSEHIDFIEYRASSGR